MAQEAHQWPEVLILGPGLEDDQRILRTGVNEPGDASTEARVIDLRN